MNATLMAILLSITLITFTASMLWRLLPLLVMQPDLRWDRPFSRLVGMARYALGQARFFRRFELIHGIAHVLIFWGFIFLAINTVHLVGRGFVSDWSLPGLDKTRLGLIYAFLKDGFVLAVMVGTAGALARRILLKPQRMTLSAEANCILIWIFIMMALDVLYTGTLFILAPDHPEQSAAFMGALGRKFLEIFQMGEHSTSTALLNGVGLWGHVIMVFVFLNYLPYGKHFHVILSLPGAFFSNPEKKGELAVQDLENEETVFGVSRLEDFSWKRALDMYNCTECGRCQVNCPAYLSGKPLSPKQLIMDERELLKTNTPSMARATWYKLTQKSEKCEEELAQTQPLLGGVIQEETLWACTTCGNCIENCPILIEHVPNIVDMRRNLVQMEGRFPRELNAVFKGWENMSNPWSAASNTRGDWFRETGVKTPEDKPAFDYLYYVGCAGSFDERNKKVSRALIRLLQKADIDFVCLGNNETCCGETARRLGNEFLAQSLIMANIDSWKTLGVKKIITTCPHCYHVLKNDYRQFGGDFDVISHTELIRELINEGKLTPVNPFAREGTVTFHDSCYLGRYNSVFDEPRAVAASVPGITLTEPDQCRSSSVCCGAGGGRMWMEESTGERINRIRCDQLLSTGAKTFATSCPYCLIMLEDAVNDKGLEDDIKVFDLAEIVSLSA